MQGLAFSYGVHPVDLAEEPDNWRGYAQRLLLELGLPCKQVLLVAGPSPGIRKPTNAWNSWFLIRLFGLAGTLGSRSCVAGTEIAPSPTTRTPV